MSMDSEDSTVPDSPSSNLPFPIEWLNSHPEKVEEALNRLPVSEQVRCVLYLSGPEQQKLILLSQQAPAVVHQLPLGEVYQMIKEIGENDVQPVLALLSPEQVQFVFDMEWWQGDKFLPQNALDWLDIMDKANDQQIRTWFYSEDFDQKVMVLQALIKVFKADEMTDSYEGTEDLIHFTPDGTFDIYFKKPDAEPILKKVFMQLYSESQKLFHALMEAVIWYAVTPTVEKSYQWYLARNEPYGIVNLEEALQVYSLLDPDHLKQEVPESEVFTPDEAGPSLAPVYALEDLESSQFLGQCLALIKSPERFQSICWELVYVANKVMVADRVDVSSLDSRHAVMRKVLGYINIGLELGAGGDIARGEALLSRTYMQSLFQVGYAALMRLKWEAETLLKENGRLVEYVLPSSLVDHFASAVARFPKMGVLLEGQGEEAESNIEWKDLRSLQDLSLMENFLLQTRFYVRLCKQGFGLTASNIEALIEETVHPQVIDDINIVVLTTTALAQFAMFKNLTCDPLPEMAAKSFLEMIFLPNIYPDEPRKVDQDKLEAFRQLLLESSMAWTEEDRLQLDQLLNDCGQNLEVQYGGIDVKKTVLWKFTRGLMVK